LHMLKSQDMRCWLCSMPFTLVTLSKDSLQTVVTTARRTGLPADI